MILSAVTLTVFVASGPGGSERDHPRVGFSPRSAVLRTVGETGAHQQSAHLCPTSVQGSVGDPDPYVFGPPGSGSISQRYGS
jgi:hypothetical protein